MGAQSGDQARPPRVGGFPTRAGPPPHSGTETGWTRVLQGPPGQGGLGEGKAQRAAHWQGRSNVGLRTSSVPGFPMPAVPSLRLWGPASGPQPRAQSPSLASLYHSPEAPHTWRCWWGLREGSPLLEWVTSQAKPSHPCQAFNTNGQENLEEVTSDETCAVCPQCAFCITQQAKCYSSSTKAPRVPLAGQMCKQEILQAGKNQCGQACRFPEVLSQKGHFSVSCPDPSEGALLQRRPGTARPRGQAGVSCQRSRIGELPK